ncbi:linear amide C-N hydrolase [Lactobacillus sp. LC28-10]|uniref:Linear amide C-N hydrolase n=1 Tax=Secundilactobacillus angelensis TaxID=2722706 RepID=A0ABX1KXH0_9LACO|nr:linear amide C-N hydrolase [Secundilactobacillus angelensis]MCH5461803.1 linear amide C-N hydrolase [Secundilactobacillus angelensis]NLR18642.1 linear amide C-N hydrolase [Secundilactobacillus angelensis]
MCTSLTLTAADGTHLLARTMDFPNVDPWQPTILEVGTNWQPIFGESHATQYRIVGSARHLNGHYLFGDGLNSAGLACAELYFPNRTHYFDEPQAEKTNLTPQDLILWVLSQHSTIAEVAADLPNVALVGKIWYAENKVYPFHWLLADKTGATAVLEPTTLSLKLISDPLNVLTNTPELADHLQRVNQFLSTDNVHVKDAAKRWLDEHRPLPEGPIPTNRFIRTTINLWGQPQPATAATAVSRASSILDQVIIPRQTGKQPANHNFTHYIGIIDMTHLQYLQLPTDATPKSKINL